MLCSLYSFVRSFFSQRAGCEGELVDLTVFSLFLELCMCTGSAGSSSSPLIRLQQRKRVQEEEGRLCFFLKRARWCGPVSPLNYQLLATGGPLPHIGTHFYFPPPAIKSDVSPSSPKLSPSTFFFFFIYRLLT